jgi:glutamyl-tRNA reductase
LDETIAQIQDVSLYDIDDLERVVKANLDGRRQEAERAELLVQTEVMRFQHWRRESHAAPTVRALPARADLAHRQRRPSRPARENKRVLGG